MPPISPTHSTRPPLVCRERLLAIAATPVGRPVTLGLGGVACLAAVRVTDKLHFGLALAGKGVPLFGAAYLARTAAIALAAGLAAAAVADATTRGHRATAPAGAERRAAGAALGLVALALASAVLALAAPPLFSRLALEDGPVETAAAAALFLAAAVFGRAAWVTRGSDRTTAALLALGAAGATAIGGEEVSWFQRLLHFATPASFAGNMQHEFNLHNFATHSAEVAYYGGAWLFLVVAPFACDHLRLTVLPAALRRLVPGRWTLLAAAPLAAVNYEMWNAIPAQVAFFSTVAALAVYARTARRGWERATFGGSAVACAAVQAAYLAAGPHFGRLWDATEYKELFIPLGLLLASGELLTRAHIWASAPVASRPVALPPGTVTPGTVTPGAVISPSVPSERSFPPVAAR